MTDATDPIDNAKKKIWKRRPDSKMSKADLTDLCLALNLTPEPTNAKKIHQLRTYLDDSANSIRLAQDPRFMGLYAYRSDGHQKSEYKAKGKLSIDKDREDEVASKDSVPATGCVFITS
jgi:hypothetical protein